MDFGGRPRKVFRTLNTLYRQKKEKKPAWPSPRVIAINADKFVRLIKIKIKLSSVWIYIFLKYNFDSNH